MPDRRVEINDPPETEVFLDGSIKQTNKNVKTSLTRPCVLTCFAHYLIHGRSRYTQNKRPHVIAQLSSTRNIYLLIILLHSACWWKGIAHNRKSGLPKTLNRKPKTGMQTVLAFSDGNWFNLLMRNWYIILYLQLFMRWVTRYNRFS